MASHPELDVLMLCYAPSDTTDRAVASVVAHTRQPFNLLVSSQRLPCAEQRNNLLLMSRAPYVAFVDDDVEVPEGWAERLLETLETYRFDGPITVSTPPTAGPGWVPGAVEIAHPFVGMVGPRIVGTQGEVQNASSLLEEGCVRPEYVSGAVMVWKRAQWPYLFADTNFGASQYEDTDLTMQMLARGGVSVVDGRVTVQHLHALTGGTDQRYVENRDYYHGKWKAYSASRTTTA